MADADPQRPIGATAKLADPPAPDAVRARRPWRKPAIMLVVPALIVAFALYLWLCGGREVSTDNAYVQQNKVSVSSDVNGRIVAVAVHENQQVKAGDILFRIDPDPYRIAVGQADAAIATAQVNVASLQADLRGTNANITAARDAILNARQDYDRQAALMTQGFTTKARLEQSQHALEQARAQLGNAQSDAFKAQAKLETGAAVPGINPEIAAARVQRAKAALDLARTEVRSPYAGLVTQTDRLQVGQMMITGLPAVSIVKNGLSWVEANFKETDLDRMRPGQRAWLTFDSFPGVHLKGHVESIGAGTGSEFSVLPAQNATGNWIKVVQRVPVRIAIDEQSPRRLIAGQSAKVTVELADGR